MTTRGVHKTGVTMVTSRMLGAFRDDPGTRRELMALIGSPRNSWRLTPSRIVESVMPIPGSRPEAVPLELRN